MTVAVAPVVPGQTLILLGLPQLLRALVDTMQAAVAATVQTLRGHLLQVVPVVVVMAVMVELLQLLELQTQGAVVVALVSLGVLKPVVPA